jgi:uncharacterized membrane protein YidH (DUF202 family)
VAERPQRDRRPVLDRGLQAERTRLAWSRTALSFAAVGALLLHNGITTGDRLHWVPGLLGLCSAAATYLLGVVRYHATNRRVPREESMTSVGAVRTLTALTALTVVVALVLITT